jgi:long-chain acyl-CoA synthetase
MLNEDAGILVSDGDSPPRAGVSTIPALLLHSLDRHRKADAFKVKSQNRWLDVSSDEFLLRVEELFFAVRTLGIKPGDRVAIVSENRLEWAVADYAALCAGAATVPIYPTLSAPQIEVLLRDCTPALAFVSTADLLEKVLAVRTNANLRHIVSFEPCGSEDRVMRLDALNEIGRQCVFDWPAEFRRAALSICPGELATIIYTSGTTGIPKGAMLTHINLVSNIIATSDRLPLRADDVSLSLLPLSHVFQRHVDYGCVHAGASIAYTQSPLTVASDMIDVQPTFAAAVPRFFEKIHERILDEIDSSSSVSRRLFEKAVSVGRDHFRSGRSSLAYEAADRLVFRKIRERLGGRIRFFISGGAPLEKEIAEFFWSIGIPIYEGYGLSETSPVITLNGPGAMRLGTVGRKLGDQEIRIQEDGEIMVRGSNVMKGYYGMEPDTQEAFSGGWFHTGDLGEIDQDGFLKITGRKKDLIITSSGKNVAPQPIENRLKLIPYIDTVVLVGNGRSFISALIVPNYSALAARAVTHGIPFDDPCDLIHSSRVHEMVMAEISLRTEDLSPFEKIRKIALLEQEFTIAGGELTPTLKVRRQAVEMKYKSIIDELYPA